MEPLSTEIVDLSHDNRGIGRVDGKTTFISNALPGEIVNYTLKRKRGKYDEAVALDILKASDKRVQPKCAHADICGACSGQHLQHDYQIERKQALLLNNLQHFGDVTPEEILPPLLGPIWNYRYKARLGVRHVRKKEKVLVGFRESNGRYIAELNACEILHPAIGQRLNEFSQLIDGLSCKEEIPQIEVAIGGNDQIALIFRHLVPLTEDDTEQLKQFGVQFCFDIFLQPKGPTTIHKLWPENSSEFLSYQLPEFGLTLDFHPTDFTQVNPALNRKMVQLAVELLSPQATETLLDLFCGLGNFSLALATKAKHVIGVEGSDLMVKRASDNANKNNISNTVFYQADLAIDWTGAPWSKTTYDKVLLDPPRSGAQAIVEHIDILQANTLLYISCNPATLARDAGILVKEKGYRLVKAGIMDMFPHTSHVESIALFHKD